MKSFYIGGAICATDSQRESFEDCTPAQVISFLKTLEKNEEIEIQICSLGGDVFGGLQIYNALRNASAQGHKVTTHCTSIAASIASIIFMAGDECIMDSNSFLCIHLPWTMTVGNAIDMRKEADTLDKLRDQMVEIYQRKMNISREDIIAYLEAETWISADEIENFGLDCVINEVEQKKIAASIANKCKIFNNTPDSIKDLIMEENKEEIKNENEIVQEEQHQDEQPVVEVKEEGTELHITIDDKKNEDMVPKAEVDKRVSGMQSAMAKQIDSLHKEYDAKIEEFQNQLNAKDEELNSVKAEVISLTEKLDKTTKELSEMTSALEAKNSALAQLNANVNSPAEELPSMKAGLAKCKNPSEVVEFLKSGKYTK